MAELISTGQREIKPTIVAKRTLQALEDGYPLISNEGGSSSSKTFSTVFILILLAAFPDFRRKVFSKSWPDLANKPLRISFVSHSLPHVKRGVYRDFKVNMNELAIWDDNQWRATDFIYTFKDGSYIELFGLEDESRARGPRRDILYVNEANLIQKQLFDQLAMRTVGPKLIDLNPSDFNCWCYEVADNPKNKRIHSTYKDNIQNLSQSQIEYIESYKDLPDDFLWKVFALGERGAAKELIFTKWQQFDEFPNKGDVFYGLDFGYTNPSGLVKIEHYEGANYVQELIYERGLTKPELFDKIVSLVPEGALIYADAAEPDSIEELYRMGLNIHPAKKDVWAGIVSVKSYPLFIQGKNLVSEMQSYKWKKDKNDNVLEEPVKDHDHLIDATRYAIHTHLNKPQISWEW